MPRPVHFDIAADDPERAIGFYQSAFGWTVTKWDGPMEYWLVSTGTDEPGIDGGLTRRGDNTPPTTNTLDVDDLDAYVAKVIDAGGTVLAPKMPIPGVGWLAMCNDTEGNLFGMMQSDETAGVG